MFCRKKNFMGILKILILEWSFSYCKLHPCSWLHTLCVFCCFFFMNFILYSKRIKKQKVDLHITCNGIGRYIFEVYICVCVCVVYAVSQFSVVILMYKVNIQNIANCFIFSLTESWLIE